MDSDPARRWLQAQPDQAVPPQWTPETRRPRRGWALVVFLVLLVIVLIVGAPRVGVTATSSHKNGTAALTALGFSLVLAAGAAAFVATRRDQTRTDHGDPDQALSLPPTPRQRRKLRGQLARRIAVLPDEEPYVTGMARRVNRPPRDLPLRIAIGAIYALGLLLLIVNGGWPWLLPAATTLIGVIVDTHRRTTAKRYLRDGPLT